MRVVPRGTTLTLGASRLASVRFAAQPREERERCTSRPTGPSTENPACAFPLVPPAPCAYSSLDDHPAVHERELVADLARKAEVARHHHHRHAGARQVLHHRQDLAHQLGVQRRGRFVEQHQLRVHGQGAGDGNPLLLPARELRGILSMLAGQPDAIEQPGGAVPGPGGRRALHPDRRLDHVLQRGHVRKQVELLEHHPDVAPHACHLALGQLIQFAAMLAVADQLAGHPDPATVDGFQVVDTGQQRALARSGRADDAHHATGRHVHVDVAQHLARSVALRQATDLQHVPCLGCDGAHRWRNFRSRKCWPSDSTETMIKYHSEATISSGIV